MIVSWQTNSQRVDIMGRQVETSVGESQMKCSQCGQEADSITTIVASEDMTSDRLCFDCLAKNLTKTIDDLEEVDRTIAAFEEQAQKLGEMLKNNPTPVDVPEGLQGFAMTPMSVYKGAQSTISQLKVRRMELLTSAHSKYRLEYELKQSVESEEYERAKELWEKLQQFADGAESNES